MSRPQVELILAHLMRGKPITPIQALSRFGVFRLAARIATLRERGFDIVTRTVKRNGKAYASYQLSR